MLTEREQEIVDEMDASRFGAYLQWAWIEYPSLQEEINERKYPEQKRLKVVSTRMNSHRIEFDTCYLFALPEKEVNPLQIEQEAWRLLSPYIRQHVDEFGVYIISYSPQTAEQQQLLTYVNTGWNLLQQWKIISQSFKTKEQQSWAVVGEREAAVRDLIQELRQRSSARTRVV